MTRPVATSPSLFSSEEVAAPPDLQPTDAWEDSDEDIRDARKDGEGCNADVDVKPSLSLSCKSSEGATTLGSIDSFLSSWTTWSCNALLTDRALSVLQWSLWLSSRLARPEIYRRSRFRRLRQLSDRMNPEMSPGLRAMYARISDTRYAIRLNGLPLSLHAARTGSWGAGWDGDPRIEKLGRVMAWSMAFYYPLEHVAYARWVAPKWITADAERYTALSCRFWAVYIWADWASSILKLKELGRRKAKLEEEERNGHIMVEEATDKKKEIDQAVKQQWLHMARCALFALPAIHWSLPKWEKDPWLSENVVNGLMFAGSITNFYQSICAQRT
uniref:Uncharacterized protein n=1 Tax=Odontella aurita TaxID=265563 RepID=A0A7S4J5P6_9STRA|mmetsp:Transcript_39267/g.118106  ORF Transcript_39267/g.118106 Transcript_39267/m.118106 type:complete len:330 (+) Transcript_39267:210-1199(+)|eukprot:CAMPEP_0113589554 /NCGR_PEP_ID=MMETSP0015_2-20120614/36149_1 /TAXON_ID=2838 /ORGANISM="Odontella" /LENGTH=329 /DNA_ID=CAMNT_0000495579 /DNA_START=56 /DNA_END=1045 /DNA_ORIENTATION=+ /assembly_acc=CAM_ASM_000160